MNQEMLTSSSLDDVVQSHILPRLDGSSLASLSCTCSNLHTFSSHESLWKSICSSTWPSSADPRVQSVISTFPSGHRSFFSDSFPFLSHGGEVKVEVSPSVDTKELISAVDIFYKDEVIFSKVHVTETVSKWFICSPVRFDLVEPKEMVPTKVSLTGEWEDETWIQDFEENLTLSWILIDPASKRAANVSTRKPVSVHRHWLTGEVHVRFSTVFAVGEEQVEFMVSVVLAGRKIREVSLVVEDMEGVNLGGRRGLVVLTAAMEGKRRRKAEGKEEYNELMNRKKMMKEEMKWRREKGPVLWTGLCFVAVLLLGFLLCLLLFVHKNVLAIVKRLVK